MVMNREGQGRLMELKEQIRRNEYVVDVDAVAQAIVRRLVAAERRERRSDEVLEAAKGFGSTCELHT